MKTSFASTRKKIALLFAISLSGFILITTISIIFLVVSKMDAEAEKILNASIFEIVNDFEKDNLAEKSVKYQSQSISDKDESEQYVQNINVIRNKTISKENKILSEVLDDEVDQDIIVDFDNLQANKRVFSRVIKPNGDILFSSDLFNALFIDVDTEGFNKQIIENTCVYLYTTNINSGIYSGYIVQAAQYCPFTQDQQKSLFVTMFGVTLLILILTYFAGLIVSKWLLKPLRKSIEQTREFAQNCHHELLTPISVALTTVEASEKSKEYKKGIASIKEDLFYAHDSLKLLSSRAFHEQAKFSLNRINISSILNKTLADLLKKYHREDIVIDKDKIQNGIYQVGEATSVKLIFRNLLSNALKYTKKDGFININLNKKEFIITNLIDEIENINVKKFFERHYRGTNGDLKGGKGIGLSIVKELVELHSWKISINKNDRAISIVIRFK
ncbi:HAMP domain-containing histidine kinase [Patescibacteria group bacterium]|nr:HAMP domain-containing histidine kinase [Patescibacteria group bacterium]